MYRSCLATAWRPEPKKGAGGGAEVRGRPTHDTGQGTRECHALMAIERVSRAFTVITHRHSSTHPHTGNTPPGDTHRVSRKCVTRCRPEAYPLRISRAYDTHRRPGRPANESPRYDPGMSARTAHISPLSPLYGCTLHGWQRGRRIATQHIPQGLHTPPRTWALSLLADGM